MSVRLPPDAAIDPLKATRCCSNVAAQLGRTVWLVALPSGAFGASLTPPERLAEGALESHVRCEPDGLCEAVGAFCLFPLERA
jgi:hypothetical protein